MTQPDRVERLVSDWLADAAQPRTPDYFPDILAQTARTRQRAAWTFPERWLPVSVTTRQRAVVGSIPWRPVLIALILMALLGAALLAAGSQRHVPAPFGPAANGAIAFEQGGDIYTVDPRTNRAQAITSGPEFDTAPRWSRDGTHLAFERKVVSNVGPGWLYVVAADGSGLTRVTPDAVILVGDARDPYEFSPDGRELLFVANRSGVGTINIAPIDGKSPIRTLDVGMRVDEAAYRPPTGNEIAFTGLPPLGIHGLYVVPATGGTPQTLVEPGELDLDDPSWSPDGTRIAYNAWDPYVDQISARVHVVDIGVTGNRTLPLPPSATWAAIPTWSNDGSRVAFVNSAEVGYDQVYVGSTAADGTGVGVASNTPVVASGTCCIGLSWSPDDSVLLVAPLDSQGRRMQQLIWEPQARNVVNASWPATSDPAWQRVAP